MSEHTHIIERVNIEVDVPDMSTATHIRDNVQQFLYGNVLPQLESMLNGVSTANEFYRANALSLEFSFESKAHFDEKFSSELLGSLGKIITTELHAAHEDKTETDKKEQFEKKLTGEKRWQVFIYFLANGSLPWFASRDREWLAENEILAFITAADSKWKLSFHELIRYKHSAIKRLLDQFSSSFISRFISAYIEQDITAWEQLYMSGSLPTDTDIVLQQMRKNVFSGILRYLATLEVPVRLSDVALEEIIIKIREKELNPDSNDQTLSPPEKAVEEKDEKIVEENEGIYVCDAGLILLHPFLQYFFDELGLLENKQFKDFDARQTAVHLLYYLATGREQPMEYDLLMEKYLCGSYIHQPMERFISLTDSMKKECEQLLRAAIGHWNALKGTSPDGMREGFLQRNGKLKIGDSDKLVVENKSFDILLEKLPWGYSVISLPWLNKELYVDWG